MTLPVADPSLFADASSLASLKRAAAANNPQALKEAAQQFESLFIDMMLKSMRAANFKDPLFGSSQQSMYQDMYDQQLSIELSKSHAFGLADMLVQQLRREGLAGGAPSSTSATGSATGRPSAAGSLSTGGSAPLTHTASSATVSRQQQTAFARELWPEAERSGQQLGVSPVSLIAQAALETNWGHSMPRDAAGAASNNLFWIKAGAAWSGTSVVSGTHEYRDGVKTAVKSSFRAYGSCAQCFQDYTALLRGNPRYAAALGTGGDVHAFAMALQQGGYATDPDYARKLTAVAGTLSQLIQGAGAAPLKLAAVAPIHTGSEPL